MLSYVWSVRAAARSAGPGTICLLWLSILVSGCQGEAAGPPAGSSAVSHNVTRPNILLILVDDLGYSDLGAFGSEISTPSLDALAESGIRMTNMHVNTVCTQTRSMLLTGVDNHRAGIGTMAGDATASQLGKPGYEMYLNNRVVTFPRLLQDAGYHTYMAGKWDMGGRGRPDLWPVNRGFEKSFALIEGSADHFEKLGAMTPVPVPTYVENNREVDLPADFYSSKNYASKLIQFIDDDKQSGNPFFAYLALTAPHYPVQAPDAYIDRYQGIYEAGYDEIREKRIARQKKLGVTGKNVVAASQHAIWPEWKELTPAVREMEIRRMQVYAGMVEAMDFHIGRVLDYLDEEGLTENTLLIFLSDNGPDGGNPLDWGWGEFIESTRDLSVENMGRKRSYLWMGPGWAHVSAAPYKLSKGFMSGGGVKSPTIVSFQGHIPDGKIDDTFASVLDISSTILEFAGVSHPGSRYDGRPVFTPTGRSMAGLWLGETQELHLQDDVFGLEVYNRRALIKGDWKISYSNAPWGKEAEWEMFDIKNDPTERRDRAADQPARFNAMKKDWDVYVEENGVIIAPEFPLLWTNTTNHYEWHPPPSE